MQVCGVLSIPDFAAGLHNEVRCRSISDTVNDVNHYLVVYLQLRRHFETDTLPWVQRLHQKEQELQRRLLKVRLPLIPSYGCTSVIGAFHRC